jgi:hypothetical protein
VGAFTFGGTWFTSAIFSLRVLAIHQISYLFFQPLNHLYFANVLRQLIRQRTTPEKPFDMHPTTRSGLPLIIAFLSICLQARCNPISNQTFTYPRGAGSSSPDVSDLFIHINDSVVVEYTILPSTTAVGIDVICYQSILDAQVNETWIFSDTADYGGRENLQHCKYCYRRRECDAALTSLRLIC